MPFLDAQSLQRRYYDLISLSSGITDEVGSQEKSIFDLLFTLGIFLGGNAFLSTFRDKDLYRKGRGLGPQGNQTL